MWLAVFSASVTCSGVLGSGWLIVGAAGCCKSSTGIGGGVGSGLEIEASDDLALIKSGLISSIEVCSCGTCASGGGAASFPSGLSSSTAGVIGGRDGALTG